MSSANSTEVEKTEDSSPVYEFEKSLSDSISKKFPNIEIVYVKQNRIRVNVKKEEIIDVASFIRDELRFDHAESVSGIDYPEDKQIEVVYHLGSYTDPLLSKQILLWLLVHNEKMIHIRGMTIQNCLAFVMFFQVFHSMKESVLKC